MDGPEAMVASLLTISGKGCESALKELRLRNIMQIKELISASDGIGLKIF